MRQATDSLLRRLPTICETSVRQAGAFWKSGSILDNYRCRISGYLGDDCFRRIGPLDAERAAPID